MILLFASAFVGSAYSDDSSDLLRIGNTELSIRLAPKSDPEDMDFRLLYINNVLAPKINSPDIYSPVVRFMNFVDVVYDSNRAFVILETQTGGNGCPSEFYSIVIEQNGQISISDSFGTCSSNISVLSQPIGSFDYPPKRSISVYLPNFVGPGSGESEAPPGGVTYLLKEGGLVVEQPNSK
jgi:hypothetical protein